MNKCATRNEDFLQRGQVLREEKSGEDRIKVTEVWRGPLLAFFLRQERPRWKFPPNAPHYSAPLDKTGGSGVAREMATGTMSHFQ